MTDRADNGTISAALKPPGVGGWVLSFSHRQDDTTRAHNPFSFSQLIATFARIICKDNHPTL